MWGVDQVKTIDGTDSVAFGFTKIGTYVQNAPQELWFLRSDNLLTEKNASKVTWKLLPEGDHGILPPGVKSGPPIDMVGDDCAKGSRHGSRITYQPQRCMVQQR